ncbi:hypothetical protein AAHE18_03G271800 [Arachis hypogaea]
MTEKFLPLLLALVVLCSSLSVLLPRSPLHRVCFLILDAATRFYRRRYTWGDGRPFCVISEVPGSSDEDYFEEVYNVTILRRRDWLRRRKQLKLRFGSVVPILGSDFV